MAARPIPEVARSPELPSRSSVVAARSSKPPAAHLCS
jgi:hypothetical protein